MKTFTERWIDGKLVRGEEAAAPAALPTQAEAFAKTMYGALHGDADPPRGYHTAAVDNAPKTRRPLFERADVVSVVDIIPGAR